MRRHKKVIKNIFKRSYFVELFRMMSQLTTGGERAFRLMFVIGEKVPP